MVPVAVGVQRAPARQRRAAQDAPVRVPDHAALISWLKVLRVAVVAMRAEVGVIVPKCLALVPVLVGCHLVLPWLIEYRESI